MKPSGLMKLTAMAISSAWPASMRRGEPPLLRTATLLPWASLKVSSANCLAYSSHTRWPRISWPEGLGVFSRRLRNSSEAGRIRLFRQFRLLPASDLYGVLEAIYDYDAGQCATRDAGTLEGDYR